MRKRSISRVFRIRKVQERQRERELARARAAVREGRAWLDEVHSLAHDVADGDRLAAISLAELARPAAEASLERASAGVPVAEDAHQKSVMARRQLERLTERQRQRARVAERRQEARVLDDWSQTRWRR